VKNYLSQLLNVHGSNFIKYTEIKTAQPSGTKFYYIIEKYITIYKFKKAYDSDRSEVVYYDFGILMKLVRLMKTCSDTTYSNARTAKYLSDAFSIHNTLKRNNASWQLLPQFVSEK
jgi:hypothetical protein